MGRKPLSIDAQIARMQLVWPGFTARRVDRARQRAQWVGSCVPQFTRYTLKIDYQLGFAPEVRVMQPALVRLPDNPEGSLPHVYSPADDPHLCLYDSDANEWNWSMPVADTIVGWAFDWLACYEFWLMTGRWTGGGRHPGQARQVASSESAES